VPPVDDRVPDRLLLLRRAECPLPRHLWVTAATFGVGLVLLLMAVIFALIELGPRSIRSSAEDFVSRMSEECWPSGRGPIGTLALAPPRPEGGA
jgi:hypothetical protein